MSYAVTITDTTTGESVVRTYPGEWSDGAAFWWTEGNFGCDSNRGMEFMRQQGLEPDTFPPCSCASGDNRYTVLLPDGSAA